MKIKYNEYIINNDNHNNIYLYCHKISQWIKNNVNEKFGIYSNIDQNTIEIRTEFNMPIDLFKSFLSKEIKHEIKETKIEEKNTLLIELGFLNNHYDKIDENRKKTINKEELSQRGYLPNYFIINDKICHFINKKPIINIIIKNIQSTKVNAIKINYFHNDIERKISLNTQSFIISSDSIIDMEEFKEMYLYGIGIKKSYGFSKISII